MVIVSRSMLMIDTGWLRNHQFADRSHHRVVTGEDGQDAGNVSAGWSSSRPCPPAGRPQGSFSSLELFLLVVSLECAAKQR